MLQIGVVVCVLVTVPGLVGSGRAGIWLVSPKDLVLELVGLTAASLCFISPRAVAIDRTDLLLCVFIVVSIISGSFAATDRWEALRAIGLTISGAAVFWSARYLAGRGERRALVDAVAVAIVLVSVSVLVDAFGYGLAFPHGSSRGTQANRNWAGHLIALGMPLFALHCLTGETARRRSLGLFALTISTAALVMTRSRAAWLAATVGTALPLIVLAANLRVFRTSVSPAPRCVFGLGALLVGVVLGVLLPVQLRWSSPNPYLESAKTIFAYNRGSGRFRVTQSKRSLAMAADNLVLGVGPGNWQIVYPGYLPKRMALPPKLWYPRMPNSEWITLAAERGTPAAILFLAFLASLAAGCWKSFISLRSTTSGSQRALEPLCAIAIMTELAIIGALDPVLQLGAPCFVFFLAVGALATQQEPVISRSLSRGERALAIVVSALLAAVLGLYTLDRMYVLSLIARGRDNDMKVASRIAVDPDWLYNERLWFWFGAQMNGKRQP